MRNTFSALVLALGLSACASTPALVVIDDPNCTTALGAVVNLTDEVAELGYAIELDEILHLTGDDALTFLTANPAPFVADEVYAWVVSGDEGIAEDGVYFLALLNGCAVFETATDLDTLAQYVANAAEARGGI